MRQYTLLEVGHDDFVQGRGRDMASLADRFALLLANRTGIVRVRATQPIGCPSSGHSGSSRRRPRRRSAARDC
jgi:hypothetical protein